MNNGLHSKPATYGHFFYWSQPMWKCRRIDGVEQYYEVGLEFPGVGQLFTREEAIFHINEIRRAQVQGSGFAERMVFVPTIVIVFPYQIGWEQGTYVFASDNRNCRESSHAHAFEITANGYPRRKTWYPRPSEFPMFQHGKEF